MVGILSLDNLRKNNICRDFYERKNMKRMKYKLFIVLICMTLIGIPAIVNILMCLTDVLYIYRGWTLSPVGVGNKEWIAFWGNYLVGITALGSALLVWIASKKERKRQNNIEIEHIYTDDLKREQQTLVNICRSIDTSVAYNLFVLNEINDLREQKQLVQRTRNDVLNGQSELELQTNIAVSLENCTDKECLYYKIVIQTRDIYYIIEKNYLEMLKECDWYLIKRGTMSRLYENLNGINSTINQQELKLKQNQSLMNKIDPNNPNHLILESEIFALLSDIKKAKSKVRDINVELEKLQNESKACEERIIDLNDKIKMDKPKLINYAKNYIDYKRRKTGEIIETGVIQMKCSSCIAKNR